MRPFFRNLSSASSYLGPDRQAAQDSFGVGGQDESALAPFLLEHRSHDVQPNGSFKPDTRISLSPGFGASGLLRLVGPDELATLLLVLSSVKPDGGFVATPETLAPLLGVSRRGMRRRLDGLAWLAWRGQPLVTAMTAENGLRLYVPATRLFEVQSNAIIAIPKGEQAKDVMPLDVEGLPPSRREESIARSRELYARPRGEVESEIERFLNSDMPDFEKAPPAGDEPSAIRAGAKSASAAGNAGEPEATGGRQWLALKKRLFAAGLSHHQANSLLESYPFERIERQLDWLPHRDARSPVAYLLAAVAGDYEPPRSLPPLPASELPATTEDHHE